MTEPVIPDYGRSTLSDLFPSMGAHLGARGAVDVLGLPGSSRYVVLLVDGLGWEQLQAHPEQAGYLNGLMVKGRPITSGVPSTTATSIACLGTGLTPGQHGIAGYAFRYPATGRVLNALLWEPGLSGLDVQPQLTYFERLSSAGVRATVVAPTHFEGSGLTTAAFRGPAFLGIEDEDDRHRRLELTARAAANGPKTLVYVYERDLDHAGHTTGVMSPQWLRSLSRIDRLARDLRAILPGDVRLVVTGDHGMVDIPGKLHRIMVEDEPELLAEVDVFAGEGRLRQLYVGAAAREAVVHRWRERLGDLAWVRTRDEAVEEGWFGPMSPRLADRFGDVLVAMRSDHAVMTRSLPKELSLVGMHGSLTSAEMLVPLLVD